MITLHFILFIICSTYVNCDINLKFDNSSTLTAVLTTTEHVPNIEKQDQDEISSFDQSSQEELLELPEDTQSNRYSIFFCCVCEVFSKNLRICNLALDQKITSMPVRLLVYWVLNVTTYNKNLLYYAQFSSNDHWGSI